MRLLPSSLLAVTLAAAAPTVVAQTLPIVRVNLGSRAFETVPPFDQSFAIAIKLPSDVINITLVEYGPATDFALKGGGTGTRLARRAGGADRQPVSPVVRGDDAVFRIGPIPPNQRYLFRFSVVSKSGNPTPATTSTTQTVTVTQIPATGTTPAGTTTTTVTTVANTPAVPGKDGSSAMVNVIGTAAANLTNHFDTDFGIVWSPRPGPAYVGAGSNVHFYFVPINKSESLENRRPTLRDQVLKRLSVFAGLAFVKLHASESVENRSEFGNFVTGVGLRPRFSGPLRRLDFFRLNGGVMYFHQTNSNPLITELSDAHAPFVSVTGDLDLRTVLGPLAALLGIR